MNHNISDKFTFGENVSWWVGIVEKRLLKNDARQIGVCKVRIFGHHTGNKSVMPTDDLPDAYPAESLQGTFFSTPKEGDTVCGIFLDDKKQSLLMLFKLPAFHMTQVNAPEGEGYRDARSEEELKASPRQSVSRYSYDPQHGVTVTENDAASRYPAYPSYPSLPFFARSSTASKWTPDFIDPTIRKSYASSTRFATAKGDNWFERPSEYGAVYPFNHVYQSESLHVMEFDDTPGAERVTLRHRLGSGDEFFPDGSRVEKIVKDNYTVILGDDRVGVSGAKHVHIKGDHTLYVQGDMTQHVSGNYQLSVDGDYKRLVKGSVVTNTEGSSSHDAKGDIIQKAGGTLWLKGSLLQENSGSTPDVDTITDFDLPNLPADTLSSDNQKKVVDAVGSPFATKDDKDESPYAAVQGDVSTAQVPPDIMTCPVVENPQKAFDSSDARYRMMISKYYQLADFTIRALYPHPLVAQLGLDQSTIICNLSFLATQIVDVLAQKYPGFTINSGFRKQQTGTSQHEKGQAVDLQWTSIKSGSLSKYVDIANWIKNNVPFDQIILEHGTSLWIHVSFSRDKNRYEVLTMKDGVFTPGLNLYGRT